MGFTTHCQHWPKLVCNLLVNNEMTIKCDTNAMKPGNEMVNAEDLPGYFPVIVVMERRPAEVSAWVDHIWKAVGVTVGNTLDSQHESMVEQQDGFRLYIYPGYQVNLHIDECDSYYHNLMSPSPQCYVIVRQDEEDDEPRPFIVSLSFDEAHAYLEGDDTVFAVDMPAELYRWTESFVLTHYCPQQLKKRKRKDWRKQASERPDR